MRARSVTTRYSLAFQLYEFRNSWKFLTSVSVKHGKLMTVGEERLLSSQNRESRSADRQEFAGSAVTSPYIVIR